MVCGVGFQVWSVECTSLLSELHSGSLVGFACFTIRQAYGFVRKWGMAQVCHVSRDRDDYMTGGFKDTLCS